MYSGYRIEINGVKISNSFISQGSYSLKKTRRVLSEYYDANGVKHEELSNRETAEISFSIRERSMKEQEQLSAIFAQYENVTVTYWDDASTTYKTGIFKMERPRFSHRNTRHGSINYAKTTINLKEY